MPYQPFVVRLDCGPAHTFPATLWKVRGTHNQPADGHPTVDNLEKFVRAFEAKYRVTVRKAGIYRPGAPLEDLPYVEWEAPMAATTRV